MCSFLVWFFFVCGLGFFLLVCCCFFFLVGWLVCFKSSQVSLFLLSLSAAFPLLAAYMNKLCFQSSFSVAQLHQRLYFESKYIFTVSFHGELWL